MDSARDLRSAAAAVKTDPLLLERLLAAARDYKMTPAEVFEQRVSFVYGQMSGAVSKAWVRKHLAEFQGSPSSAEQTPAKSPG